MTAAGAIGAAWLLLAAPAGQPAATVQLRWQPVERDTQGGPETVSHYLVHYGRRPRPAGVAHPHDDGFCYQQVRNAGGRTALTLPRPAPGTWFFAVVAVDIEGNPSAYSAEVVLEVPDAAGRVPAPLPPPAPPAGPDRPAASDDRSDGCATADAAGPWGWLIGLAWLAGRRRWGALGLSAVRRGWG
jgi:hypothetical protein